MGGCGRGDGTAHPYLLLQLSHLPLQKHFHVLQNPARLFRALICVFRPLFEFFLPQEKGAHQYFRVRKESSQTHFRTE